MKRSAVLLCALTFALSAQAKEIESCSVALIRHHPSIVAPDAGLEVLVREMEANYHLQEKTSEKIAEHANQMGQLDSQMNFRELFLFGWLAKLLGGDAKKIDGFKDHRANRAALEVELEKLRKALPNYVRDSAIQDWLKVNDSHYNAMLELKRELNRTVCATTHCLRELSRKGIIETVYSEGYTLGNGYVFTDSLTGREVFPDSYMYAVVSAPGVYYDRNSEAFVRQGPPREISAAHARDLLTDYQVQLVRLDTLAERFDGPQPPTVNDLADNDLNVLEWTIAHWLPEAFAHLNGLAPSDNTNAVIDRLESQLVQIRNQMDEAAKHLERELDARVCATREACLSKPAP